MAFRIGIIGAGPAGLVTALALEEYCKSHQEVEITLIDKNQSAFDYPGVEYGIQARACLALKRIGIKEKALACGLSTDRISFFNARKNKKQRLSVKTNPDLTVTVLRQEFLAELTNLLSRTKIHRQCTVNSIQATPEKVHVLCEDAHGKDESFEFDFLVAADGVGSIVRKNYFKHQDYIHDRGFSCLYMLIEVPQDGPAYYKKFSNTGECWIVLGKTTAATFFPMGKNRFAVGIGFDDQVQADIWRSAGVSPNQTWADIDVSQKQKIAELLAADCPFQDNMLSKVFGWIPDWNSYKIYLWKMRDTDVSTQPYNEYGNIIMIGDAAHAIMPTIGMGASLAIEDAEMLARQLSDHILRRKVNVKNTIKHYSSLRVPVWEELVARSRAGARLNFIGLGKKSRMSIGPQVPGRRFWRVVAAIEEFIG